MRTVVFCKTAHPKLHIIVGVDGEENTVYLDEDELVDLLKYVNKYMTHIVDKAIEDNY